MGRNKQKRTDELRQLARNHAIQSEVQSQIQEHNFRKLVASGVIVKDKEKENKMPNGGLRGIEETREEKVEEAKIITGQNAPKLKNEFRDEVRNPYAGIPEDELIKRDQAVLLRELRFREEGFEADRKHFETAIVRAKEVRLAVLAMPKSLYRELFLNEADAQIKAQTEKAAKMRLSLPMVLSLLALEEIFAQTEIAKSENPPDEDEDDLTIPDEQPGDDVDEDDDNPTEVI